MADILTAFGIDARLLGVQIFNFTLLAVALWYLLYRPVIDLIEARRKEASEAARALDMARRELSKAEEEREQALAEIAQKRQMMLEAAEAEARARAKDIREAAQKEAAAIIAEAQRVASHYREQTRLAMQDEVARLVAQGVAKVCAEKSESSS